MKKSTAIMRAPALILAVGVAACGEGAPAATFAVADSAGVQIVTTSTPIWTDASPPWTLTLEMEVGELEGDEPYLFGEPVSAVRLADGRVAVADAQSADVRFFDAEGDFVSRAGTRGQGPGEFTSFGWLERCGDRLWAYDWMQRRVTPISFEGVAGDPSPFLTPEENSPPPYSSTCLPDGSFLAVGWGDRAPMPDGDGYLFFAQRAELWRISATLDDVVALGSYISSERLMRYTPQGGGSGPHPFSRSVVFAGDSDRIYIGGAERLQIEVRSYEGDLLEIYRGPDSDLLIDDAFVARYRSVELTPRDSALRRQINDADSPMPERYPAYSALRVDPLGFLWVERFVLPWDVQRRWGVFDPDGRFLGHLEVPPEFQVTDITEDHLTGIATDELGVSRIRVYRLDRPAL